MRPGLRYYIIQKRKNLKESEETPEFLKQPIELTKEEMNRYRKMLASMKV